MTTLLQIAFFILVGLGFHTESNVATTPAGEPVDVVCFDTSDSSGICIDNHGDWTDYYCDGGCVSWSEVK